jgi:hypothetical protein
MSAANPLRPLAHRLAAAVSEGDDPEAVFIEQAGTRLTATVDELDELFRSEDWRDNLGVLCLYLVVVDRVNQVTTRALSPSPQVAARASHRAHLLLTKSQFMSAEQEN